MYQKMNKHLSKGVPEVATEKCLRTTILKNICKRLLLEFFEKETQSKK